MPKTRTYKFTRKIQAPASEVYRALTNPTALRDWLSDAAESDPRPGGRIYLWWNSGFYATGEYTALEPGRKVAYTWNGVREPSATSVKFTLAEQDGATQVTLTHSGVGTGKAWAGMIRAIDTDWPGSLENLQSLLETGIDLRFARRPRLGIFIGDTFNPELAKKLGVPVSRGIYLEGTMEGTGARAASLQKDDVLIKLGGKRADDFPSLGNALAGHQAGDKVKVEFYRGAEKKTATMELSKRPMPAYPATGKELADLARKNYAAVNAEYNALLAGLTETQAEFRPTPKEWNVKETLAHFIACERDLQSWLAELVNGGNNAGEVVDSLEYRPNVTVRLRAIVERFPTVPDLMVELERAEEETLSFVANLPEPFLARKHLYSRAAGWIIETAPEHFRGEHMGIVRSLIDQAKK